MIPSNKKTVSSIMSCGTDEKLKVTPVWVIPNAPSTLFVDEGNLEHVTVLTRFSPQPNVTQMRRETIPGVSVRSILAHFMSFLQEDCVFRKSSFATPPKYMFVTRQTRTTLNISKIEMPIAPLHPHDVEVDLSRRSGKLESKRAGVKHAVLKERHLDVSEEKWIDDNQSVCRKK